MSVDALHARALLRTIMLVVTTRPVDGSPPLCVDSDNDSFIYLRFLLNVRVVSFVLFCFVHYFAFF